MLFKISIVQVCSKKMFMKKMAKAIFIGYLLIGSVYCSAQNTNWQTFYSTNDNFYKGNILGGSQPIQLYGYIRSGHIDSVRFINNDSVFYFFKTIRNASGQPGSCMDTSGSCWLGEKVIIKPNGNNVLFNKNNDSIIIKTNAVVNDSFPLFKFSNGNYIQATVSAISQSTIMGVTDSIKTFTLEAKDLNGNGIANSYNGNSFSISKQSGIITNFCWYDFPLTVDTFKFNLTNANRLTFREIYDYTPGDVFQFYNGCWTPSSSGTYGETKIIDKWYSFNSDTVFYSRVITGKYYIQTSTPPYWDSVINVAAMDTIYYTDLDNHLFEGKYPEQAIVDTTLQTMGGLKSYVLQQDDNVNGLYLAKDSRLNYQWNGLCFEMPFELIENEFTYIQGIGNWQSKLINSVSVPQLDCYSYLFYYKHGNFTYGNPTSFVLGINEIIDESRLLLYPNPANLILTLYSREDLQEVKVYDIFGKCVMETFCIAALKEVHLDISKLSSGLYFLALKFKSDLFTKKIIINH
jgi:hypothetical protein